MGYKESLNDFINSHKECDLINRCIIPDGGRKPENFPNVIR